MLIKSRQQTSLTPHVMPCVCIPVALDVGVLGLANFFKHLGKEAVGQFHNVVLDHTRHRFTTVRAGVIKSVADDALTPRARDELQALVNLIGLAMLNPSVQILFILTHNHHIDLGVLGRYIRVVGHARAHIGVETQGFANRHV